MGSSRSLRAPGLQQCPGRGVVEDPWVTFMSYPGLDTVWPLWAKRAANF